MKNPLEFSLLEIERLMAIDPDPDAVTLPQAAYTELVRYIHDRIKREKEYEVKAAIAEVRQRKNDTGPSRLEIRNLEQQLLDEAEIVTLDQAS